MPALHPMRSRQPHTARRPDAAGRGLAGQTPPDPQALQRQRAIHEPGWLRPLGHVEGMSASGRHIYLAGQLGWDAQARFAATDLVGQVRQALANVRQLLARAGAGPEHITRMTWFLVDPQAYLRSLPEIARAWSELLGRTLPPMSTVAVSALLHEGALVQMDVTAVVDEAGARPPQQP